MEALSLDLSCLEFLIFLNQELFYNSCLIICSECVKWAVYEVDNHSVVFVFYLQQFCTEYLFKDASLSDVLIGFYIRLVPSMPNSFLYKVFAFSIIFPLNVSPCEHLLQYIDVNLTTVLNFLFHSFCWGRGRDRANI